MMKAMNRQDALHILRQHAEALRARGVIHAALFGSVARGDAHVQSDIDVLIDLDPSLKLDIFAYAGLQRFVSDLFGGAVDVVDRQALKPHLRGPVTADAIHAF